MLHKINLLCLLLILFCIGCSSTSEPVNTDKIALIGDMNFILNNDFGGSTLFPRRHLQYDANFFYKDGDTAIWIEVGEIIIANYFLNALPQLPDGRIWYLDSPDSVHLIDEDQLPKFGDDCVWGIEGNKELGVEGFELEWYLSDELVIEHPKNRSIVKRGDGLMLKWDPDIYYKKKVEIYMDTLSNDSLQIRWRREVPDIGFYYIEPELLKPGSRDITIMKWTDTTIKRGNDLYRLAIHLTATNEYIIVN